MKIMCYALIAAVLFFKFDVNCLGSEKTDSVLSEKQKLITQLVQSVLEPLEIKWINAYTMDVTIGQDLLDVNTEAETNRIAELITKLGYEITHQTICAKITDPNGKERAYHCVDKTNEFAEEQVLITETQEEIARRIKTISGVTQVKWMTPSLLEISIDFGLDPKSTGEKIAEMLTPWVNESTGKPVCLRITNTDKEEVAYKCVGKDQQI